MATSLLALLASASLLASAVAASPPVVVVGAGPSSLFFTNLYLRSHPDASVHIIERSDPPPPPARTSALSSTPSSSSPAFGFGLGTRARRTLASVPGLVDRVESASIPIDGRDLWMVNRAELCGVLLDSCMDEAFSSRGADEGAASGSPRPRPPPSSASEPAGQSPRLECSFGATAGAIDREARTIAVEKEDGSTEHIAYSLLIGADGVNSRVRNELENGGVVSEMSYVERGLQFFFSF